MIDTEVLAGAVLAGATHLFTKQFPHLQRPFGLHPDADLPADVRSLGSIRLVADEVGTGMLVTAADAVRRPTPNADPQSKAQQPQQ